MSRTFSRFTAALLLGGRLCTLPMAASDPSDELKAAIILSFLRYSDWLAAGHNPALTVGVLAESSIVETIRRVLEDKMVDNRPIKVLEIGSVWDPRCCQIIYLATDHPDEIRRALLVSSGTRVLTIGESKHFLELGGAVNLLTVDGRMSFEVSLEALERSGITISSKLLRFGQVRTSRKGRT